MGDGLPAGTLHIMSTIVYINQQAGFSALDINPRVAVEIVGFLTLLRRDDTAALLLHRVRVVPTNSLTSWLAAILVRPRG